MSNREELLKSICRRPIALEASEVLNIATDSGFLCNCLFWTIGIHQHIGRVHTVNFYRIDIDK